MKKVFLRKFKIISVLACCMSSVAAGMRQDPLLVCAIMIKNESPVIEDTLRPMVDGGIDSFLVYDTGSTDDTLDKVKAFFQSRHITNFVIEQEDFVDYSTSRNRALDLVDIHFPQATFILMPDAEWMVRNVPDLLKFCEDNKHDFHASYMIRLVQNGGYEFYVERLIRRNLHARFRFPIHEYLESASRTNVPHSVCIEYNPTRYGSDKSFKRFTRDLAILLKEYAKDPKEPRIVFYLAQTYESLGDYENALRFYELRTHMQGWAEENFMALYKLAHIVERLAQQDTKKETPYDWALAEWYYLKAFGMRNTRIEPIVHIAQHYLAAGEYSLAYLFAEGISQIPCPTADVLVVEKCMYSYTRYDILGRCAWYVGEFETGEWALKQALKQYPDDKQLVANLKFYVDRKAKTSPKIIGLIPARNEAGVIKQCLQALSLYTDAIVYLDDASDDNSVEVVESIAAECKVQKIIKKTVWLRDEPADKNALLEAGRALGGTHFIVIDADEMFTANCLEDNFLRTRILALQPGERLMLNWLHFWKSPSHYRCDAAWQKRCKDFVFCDDGICSYNSEFIHTNRTPTNLSGRVLTIEGDTYGMLHFQFLNWSNVVIKQSWYKILERIKTPEKSIAAINQRYQFSMDDSDVVVREVPSAWVKGYGFYDASVFDVQEQWRSAQMRQWIKQYGRDYFQGLDFWGLDIENL